MAFVAYPALAAAVSNAGGLGVLGATPDPPPSLPVMAGELRSLTDRPWGVDLICAETGFGPACTDGHIEACVGLQVPLVVFHHDPPPRAWIDRLDAAGTTAPPPRCTTSSPWSGGAIPPAQRYRLLPTRTVTEWAGREHQIPDPPPGPAVIGHTTLFPHSAAVP
jgi:NAD(P)H-dependent flavin oxidoreductase YrpB (nitropropane dioxygenase family)